MRDSETGELIEQYRADSSEAYFRSSGEFLFISKLTLSDAGDLLSIYNSNDGSLKDNLQLTNADAAFSPEGNRYIASGEESIGHAFFIWNTVTGEILLRLQNSENEKGLYRAIDWSPDGQYVLSEIDRNTIGVWNANTGKFLHSTKVKHSIYTAVFSPDGTKMIVGSGTPPKSGQKNPTGRATLIDTLTGKTIQEFNTQEHYIEKITFSFDGNYAFATGKKIKGLYVWKIAP